MLKTNCWNGKSPLCDNRRERIESFKSTSSAGLLKFHKQLKTNLIISHFLELCGFITWRRGWNEPAYEIDHYNSLTIMNLYCTVNCKCLNSLKTFTFQGNITVMSPSSNKDLNTSESEKQSKAFEWWPLWHLLRGDQVPLHRHGDPEAGAETEAQSSYLGGEEGPSSPTPGNNGAGEE